MAVCMSLSRVIRMTLSKQTTERFTACSELSVLV